MYYTRTYNCLDSSTSYTCLALSNYQSYNTPHMHTNKLTKIVATIGPASDTRQKMSDLIDAGVNVFRFNTKHNTPEWHNEHINLAQSVADSKGITIGILLDLQGPELRLNTRDEKEIEIKEGQRLKIGSSFVEGVDIVVPHAAIFQLVKPGDEILIDDGFVETKAISVKDDELIVEIVSGTVIKHRKGVNLPGKDIDFPSLIENDIKQLDVNAESKVDFVGLSFVRSAHDVEILRAELLKRKMNAQIIAKIESQPALDRLDEIIESSDVIMIARGDLGIEVPFEQLAHWQRVMIDKCRLAQKPVITATQMLESMIVNPRPTRAEVTDVAHAVIEGTDAVMLSGESAGGKYPVKAVKAMSRIAEYNEGKYPPSKLPCDYIDSTSIISNAVNSVVRSKIKPVIDAVLVFTETGYTARSISKYRLPVPIIAITDESKTAETLTLSYGVKPYIADLPEGPFESANQVIEELVEKNVLKHGNTVVVVHGYHWQKPGNTNSLSIITL